MRIVYYSHKKHDFSFYTSIDVNENNVIELAGLYRKRWGIENGYQERKIDIREKTHSSHMVIRQFLYFFSILVYNLWLSGVSPLNLDTFDDMVRLIKSFIFLYLDGQTLLSYFRSMPS